MVGAHEKSEEKSGNRSSTAKRSGVRKNGQVDKLSKGGCGEFLLQVGAPSLGSPLPSPNGFAQRCWQTVL